MSCILSRNKSQIIYDQIIFNESAAAAAAKSLQPCPTLYDPMNCSTPGLPVHHQLLELTQTHIQRVGDAIQPYHPLSSPSPPAPNPSQTVVLGCYLKNDRKTSVHFQGKPFNIMVIQVYAPTSNAEEVEVEQFYEDLQDLLELTSKKDVLFIIGDWNAKLGSQKTPGVTDKFGLGIWNEAGQRLVEFCQENALGHSKHPLPTTQEKTTHGHHQIINTEIRLIIFFAAKDVESLYSQQK